MRKIKLQLDALAVESFATAIISAERGTVDARQDTFLCRTGDGMTCPRARSDYLSCVEYCRCTDAQGKCYDTGWG